ncbi:hypothetical protein D3C81_2282360 [compost metagenome]
MLEEDGTAALLFQLFAHLDDGGHEEARAEQPVEQHHDGGNEKRREGEQRHGGCREYAPYRQGHAHQRHAARAPL